MTAELLIPERLRSAAQQAGQGCWLEQLPELVAQAVARWQLDLEQPFAPGGFASWTAPGRDGAGRAIVLKLPLPGSDGGEQVALAAWAGLGAAALWDSDESSLLLERLEPGTPLSGASDAEQMAMAIELLPQLWSATTAVPLPASCCDSWLAQLTDWEIDPFAEHAARFAAIRQHLPTDEPVLLHGDLHEGNILLGTDGYRVIDPRPLYGERAYEIEPLTRRYLDRGDGRALLGFLNKLARELDISVTASLAYALLRGSYYGALAERAGDQARVDCWHARLAIVVELLANSPPA